MPDLLKSLRPALADRYLIERELGRGGMAIVYLAEDRRHQRRVALKVLRPEIAQSLGGERFLREIQLAAQLNHPHILAMHDSGETDGVLWFTMPYVEGESLRDRLNREEQLPIEDALRITKEVADGLDHAHRLGVIHRDIKPENILLANGHATIADFGIAKAVSEAGGERLTETGIAVGTPAYMSPEQASGEQRLDGRSDVYSLGCVLYEMLTGEPPYTGPTAQAIVAKKLSGVAPRLSVVRKRVPSGVEIALDKALARERVDRYTSGTEFAEALETSSLLVTPSTERPAVVGGPRRHVWAWVAGTLSMAAAGTAIGVLATRHGGPQAPLPAPDNRQLTYDGNVGVAALSPDGQFLAYRRGSSIMLQDVAAGGAPRTVVDSLGYLWTLRWSPDGRRIGISGTRGTGPSDPAEWLYLAVPRMGGAPERMPITRSFRLFTWSPDGTRVATWGQTTEYPIWVHHLSSGEIDSHPVPTADTWTRGVDWSPSGELLALITSTGSRSGQSNLWVLNLDQGTHALVLTDSMAVSTPRWAPNGDAIYYLRRGALYRVDVDQAEGRAAGTAQRVVALDDVWSRGVFASSYSVSADGRKLVYTKVHRQEDFSIVRSTERGGIEVVELTRGTAQRSCPALSPDGSVLAFVQESLDGRDLFRVPPNGGAAERLTFDGSVAGCVAWGPAGRQLAFAKAVGGVNKVAVIAATGGAPRILENTKTSGQVAWAPSSRIAYSAPDNGNFRIIDPVTDEGRELPRLGDSPGVFSLQFSPDESKLAVEVRGGPIEGLNGLWVYSREDSSWTRLVPRVSVVPLSWSEDGESIYARDADGAIRRLPLAGGDGVLVPQPDVGDASCIPHERGNDLIWVCSESSSTSDVWMIENFDPAYAGRSP